MRVFIAGATGVIGARLVPLLIGAGHEVVGMTRSPDKVGLLRDLGAEPVVCDVFPARPLRDAVVQAGATVSRPELKRGILSEARTVHQRRLASGMAPERTSADT